MILKLMHRILIIRSASTKTQIIIATQSAGFVSQFAAEDIVVVSRKDGQSTFERLDSSALEEWLEEYSLGELWEKNVIGARPQAEPG
jgi:predicted ATPase